MPREHTPIELEPQPGTVSGLGSIIESTLLRFMQRAVNSAAGLLSEVIEIGFEVFLEAAEEALVDVNRPMIQRLISYLPSDSPLLPYLQAMLAPTSQAGFFSLGGFASTMGSSAAGSLLNILLRPVGYEADSLLHTARLDPAAAISAVWRGLMSEADLSDQLQDLGWSPSMIDIWKGIIKPLLSEGDIITLWLRGHIGESAARVDLHQRGFDDTQIDNLVTASRPLLGSQDLWNLYHRDLIDVNKFMEELRHRGYTPEQITQIIQLGWQLLGAGDLVELWRRGLLSNVELVARLRDHGYTEERTREIMEVGRPLTAREDLVNLFWRGELDDYTFAERLLQFGYTDAQIAEVLKLTQRIPGPADLISMAVREAFRPDLIEQYQYLAEYPAEFGEWMKKQGLSEEWAQRYWVAHWALPSLTMAYEMYHRRIIEEGDLDRLFAISDIAPFWRDKLKSAAYTPLTRVDVRRMFGMGVLDRTDVYNSYLDLGYSPENAERMTQFTERYESTEDREQTKADILSAYRAGILSRDAAKEQLTGIGYPEEWVEYYVLLEEWKAYQDLLKQEVDILQDQYIDGVLTRTDVFALLGEWNLPSAQIENYLEQWDIAKRHQLSLPTASQLDGFLQDGIITEDAYRAQMRARHYEEEAIAWYLAQVRVAIAEKARTEEEAARTEEQRVRTAEVKTTYDVETADLDLQIAELKTALAETRVLLNTVTDPELVEELLKQVDELTVAIQRLAEDKARVKLAYTQELKGLQA